MEVWLVRHPRPDLDGDRCYGRLDVGLAAGWEAAATALRAQLPGDAAIVAGPERRCRELATALAAGRAGEPVVDEDLRELDFGAWEGRAWSAIPLPESTHWAKDVWHRAPPLGETCAALVERAGRAWQSVLQMNTDRVVLVGSAGPLRALLTIALALPREAFLRFELAYGGRSLLSDALQGWCLLYLNR